MLNIKLPQYFADLANSGALTATVSATLSMRKTYTIFISSPGDFYLGVKGSTSVIKPNQQKITNWDNTRPGADKYLSGFGLSSKHEGHDGDWGDTVVNTTASATLGGAYLGIGISGMSNHYPGWSTPEARLTNITITLTYSTTIKVSIGDYGKFDYLWYENATPTSTGAVTNSGTIGANSNISKTTTNPYAFMSIAPKNVIGYRFKNVAAYTTSNLGYSGTVDVADESMPTCTIASITTSGGYTPEPSAAVKFQNKKTGNTVNYVARQYKVIYRPNGGTGSNATRTYDYDETYPVPDPDEFNFTKEGSVTSAWKYESDNKIDTDLVNANRGKQYSAGNTFSNLFPDLSNNTTEIYFDVAWADVSATKADNDYITDITLSPYSEKYSDVEVTITASRTGYTLKQVYATYDNNDSCDIPGQKIALEQIQAPNSSNVSKWMLYGICGNCKISTEWETKRYTITYKWGSGSGTNGPTDYYYGTAVSLPYVGTRTNYTLNGWTLSVASGGYLAATANQHSIPAGSYGNITATAIWLTTSVTPTSNADSTANSPDTTGVDSGGFVTAIKGLGKVVAPGSATFDATEETAVTQKVNLPDSIKNALHAGATVKATLSGTLEIGALNDNYVIVGSDPDSAKAYGRIGINGTYASYISTSYAKVYDWDSCAVYNSATQKPDAVTLGASDTQVTVYVQLKREKKNKRGDSYFYAILTKFTITYDISGGSPITITYNGNNGTTSNGSTTTTSTYIPASKGGSVTFSLPDSMFSREGYEFVGWGTASGTAASSASAPESNKTISSSTTYYAIWRAKKFPINTYDVWTDGTNYATTIRQQYYVSYGYNAYLYTHQTTTSNSGTTYSYIRHLAGGGDYSGFKVESQAYQIPNHNFETHKYVYDPTNSTAITGTNNRIEASITGAIWGYYVWNMEALTATVDSPNVDYGTSVDLDDIIHPVHAATEKEFSWTWFKGGETIEHYKNHELFLAEESGTVDKKYSVNVTVNVVRGGVTLSKQLRDLMAEVVINPLQLKVEASSDRTFVYNGEAYEFPLRTVLDEDYYKGLGYDADKISYLLSIFEQERNENRFAWYYDAECDNSGKWGYGVVVDLKGLGYSSYVADGAATDFYLGENDGDETYKTLVFKDAGKYWANLLYILQVINGSASSRYNTNYVWSANRDTSNAQIFSASQAGENTVEATIQPADGLNIYALYAQKTFGKIADPKPVAYKFAPENGSFDVEALKNAWEMYDYGKFEDAWILAIDGFVGNDFDVYGSLIADRLRRDTSAALHQSAGLYDVYLDMTVEQDEVKRKVWLALFNNYGVKLNAATDTVARPGFGTIKMRWVNKDGSIKNGEFDFTSASYDGEHNNFEILAKDLSFDYNGELTYTYNGYPQGPSQIITNGYLSAQQKADFAKDYGDGYQKFFTIYFYGIPIDTASVDWNAMSQDQQAQFIKGNDNRKHIIGWDDLNYVTGGELGEKDAISLFEVNAGNYAVVIVGAAYKDGDNFYENFSFNIASPFYINWEIKQATIEVVTKYSDKMDFGSVNYGGVSYTFKGIADNDRVKDQIKVKNLGISYDNKSADGFLRYSNLTAETLISNGDTLSVYGTFVGKYDITMDGVICVFDADDKLHECTNLYGTAESNYGRADSNYKLKNEDFFTIIARNLSVSDLVYTADSGATYSKDIPDMTYVYGVKKGTKIQITNFYDDDFLSADIAAAAGDNVLILASEIMDGNRMTLTRSDNVEYPSVDNTSATFTFLSVNAAKYSVTIDNIKYVCDGVTYKNYDMKNPSHEFEIKPKTVAVKWFLDGNPIEGSDIPGVVYDGNQHAVTAQFVSAGDGILDTDDNLVYLGDLVSNTQIYSKYQSLAPLSLQFDGEDTDKYTDVNIVDGEDSPYETYLKAISTGNYRIEENSRSISWQITRREFSISVSNTGNAHIYDGKSHGITLSFNSGGVPVTLSSFSAITSAGAEFTYSNGLIFNPTSNSFSATNVGKYELSYDATSKIKIDKNWLLTGSADYTGNNFLFAIVPRVLDLTFSNKTATYTSQNLISRFKASYFDSDVPLPDGDTVLTYNLTEIIHAGSYSVSVTSAVSASGNFVLAEENPTAWYATIADGLLEYYSDQSVIDAYTAQVTVNPYTVTLDPVAINNGLKDYVYDGGNHGYTLDYLYENFVKSFMLCDDDKEGYSLKGDSSTGKNVGTYNVSIEGFNPYNGYTDYTLKEGYSDTWAITKKPLSFVYVEYHSGGNAYVYDGNNHGYTLSVDGIVDGESIQLLFGGENINVSSPLTVGAVNSTDIFGSAAAHYSITNFSLADATVDGVTYLSSNYSLPEGGADKSWTIEKKVITVEWHNTELTYRASEYNPDNGGVYATVTNSVGSDTIQFNYGGEKSATNAGNYTVSIEDLIGGSSANYTIEGTLSTDWEIKPKQLTEFTWAGGDSGFTNTLSVTYNGANHRIVATPSAGAQNADDGKIYDADAAGFAFTYSSNDGYVVNALLANDYKTKISGCNNTNYTVPADAEVEKDWKITKRVLTVAYTYNYTAEITYCATARGVELKISGFIASDFDANLDFDIDTNAESAGSGSASDDVYTRSLRSVNVGDYTVSVKISETCARKDCYELSGTLDAAFKIVPLTASLEWKLCEAAHSNRTAEYDGKPHELIATVKNLASSSDVVNVTVTDGVQTNQGSYTGVATALDNDNYALPEDCSCNFTISPRTINAVWNATAENYTYNGKYLSDALTLSRLIADDEVSFKIEFYKETNGAETLFATAVVSKTGLTEYTLSANDFKKTIDAASYVAIFDGKVYNSDGTVNGNYTFKSNGDERTEFTVNRAALKLSDGWKYKNNGNEKVFDSSSVLVYNAKPYELVKEIDADSLFVRDDTLTKDEVTLVYSGNINTDVGAGAYTATVSSLAGTYAANYRLPSVGVSVSYEITPKGVSLVWENYTGIVYDGQTHTVTAKVEFGATDDADLKAYDGDSVTVSQYQNNAYRNANDGYVATALGLDNNNYFIKENSALDWAIAPRPVELTWSLDTVEYDGTSKTVTATVSNLVTGDVITLTYGTSGTDYSVSGLAGVGNIATNVGSYTTEVTALSNANYTLDGGKDLSHDWEITPIVLAFGWSSASGLTYNGAAQGITLTVSNIAAADFASADRLSFVPALTPDGAQTVTENRAANPIKITFAATNADTYTVTITALGGTSKDNYLLPDNASATYVIAPKVIDVDWTTGTFVYSKQNHEVTAEVVNAESDDTVILTYKTTGTDYSVSGLAGVGNAAMNAGSYATTVTAVDNANYTVSGASDLTCNWTISPKTITDVTYKLDGNESLTAVYDRNQHVLTATATGGATSDGDGKIYDGDTVGFVYEGTISKNYGLSAISANSALEAGEYNVSVTATDNGNYTVGALSCGFTVSRKTLTLSKEDVTSTAFVYDGKSQGVKITVIGLLEYDNTSARFSLDAEISPTGTSESAVRSGASYTKRFLAVNADTYTLTFALSGSRYQNYELAPFDCGFIITRKEITTQISADILADNIIYRAKAISPSDLSVTFNNLITDERLTLDDDFTVVFAKDGADLSASPINVGKYTAKISLKEDGKASVNYELIGTTEFDFEIKPYEITPNMLGWTLNGSSVRLDSLTYKDGENKTVAVSAVSDDIFNAIAGKSFSYVYFGLCNCGLDAKTSADLDAEHLAHQWLPSGGNFPVTGPEHAGNYHVVLTLSGGDADNFILSGFDGYTGNNVLTDGDDAYLVYGNSTEKFSETALPKLGDRVAALSFGIGRLHQGLVADSVPNLPFKGSAYTVATGLPKVTSAADISAIRVEIGSGTYTYEEYANDTFGAIKNAGEYSIKIYDSSASGGSGTASGCDLFNPDADIEVNVTLTIDKAKITVSDTSDDLNWSKVYDRTTAYSGFGFAKNVTFSSTTDGDGNVVADCDGVLAGTTVTISAVYDDFNAGKRTLTFTLGGADRDNYYLAFSEDGNALAKGTDYTVSGYAYAIADAKIIKRTITVAGNADKTFDSTKDVQFEIVSADVIDGDRVNVTGTYASEHVGTHAITITVDDDNYQVASDIAVSGTISPKPLTVTWAAIDATSPVYDGNAHGVTATISGMYVGYVEDVTATTAATVGTPQISASAIYTVSFTAINADDYSVVLSLKDDSDYTLSSATDSYEWTIEARTLQISWTTDDLADEAAYIYAWDGFKVAFSNVERYITPQIDNAVGADDVSLAVRNNKRANVGVSTAEAYAITGDKASNYALPETKTQAFEIVKAEIIGITLPELTTYTYNGAAQGVVVSSNVTQHGITVNVVYGGGESATANTINGKNAFINVTGDAGKKITATVAETDNYKELVLEATVVINPSEITSITLTSKTETYNGEAHSIVVNTTTTHYGDEVSVTYTIDGEAGNSAINAGAYTIVATIAADDDNYVTLTRTATLKIDKADIDENRITVNADSGKITYDTNPHGVKITVEDDVTQFGDAVTITYHGGENNSGQATNVGEYEINAVISAGNNYNDYTTAVSKLEITQKKIKLTLAESDRKFTYDGKTHTATVTFDYGAENEDDLKVYDGDTMTIKLTYEGTGGNAIGDTALKNAGAYTVSAELSNKNYVAIKDEAEITIEKATIDYYFVSDSFSYNRKLHNLSVNSEDAALSDPIHYSVNLLSTDQATVEYTYATTDGGEYDKAFTGAINAGVYYLKATITADGKALGNYNAWEATATLTITPSTLTSFTIEDVTVPYDGLEHSISVTAPEKQLVDGVYYTAHGDKVYVAYTINDGTSDVAKAINVNVIDGVVAAYVVTAHFSFDDDVKGNYRADGLEISANLTITPVTVKGISLAGENADYDGNEHNATLELPTAAGYPKYELSADGKTLTVYLADEHEGDVFNVNLYIEDFSGKAIDAGSYDFVARITPDDSIKNNYTAISDLRKTITIAKAKAADSEGVIYAQDVNLYFKDGSIEYCGNTHYIVIKTDDSDGLTHDVKDVLTSLTLYPSTNKDIATPDTAQIVYTCGGATFDGAKDVGEYVITATVSHKNYQTFTLTATLTISKAIINYYFVGAEKVYDMATHFAGVNSKNEYLDNGTVTSITLKGTDTATVSYTYKFNGEDKDKFSGALNVGKYEITATISIIGNVADNYEIWGDGNSITADLTITPYETTLIWSGLNERVYTGNNLSPVTAHFLGADGTTDVQATISYKGVTGKAKDDTVLKNAGTYEVTASHARLGNYTFTNANGNVESLTVKKAVIERYLVGASTPYNATTYYLALSSTEAANVTETFSDKITVLGETINVIYTYTKDEGGKDYYMNSEGVKEVLEVGARNAGKYTVTAALDLGDGESNFENWTDAKSATLTITRINLSVTSAKNFDKVYDGTDEVLDYTVSGVHEDNKAFIQYTAKYSDKHAGEGKHINIVADALDGYEYLEDNYTLPTISNGSIQKKALTLTAEQSSLDFWQKTYDGLTSTLRSPLTLTKDDNGFVENDNLSLRSDYNSKNVMEANKVIFSLSGADKDNYTISNLDFSSQVDFDSVYLIKPRVTNITWSPSSKTAQYTGKAQTVSAYLSVLGEDVASGQLDLIVSLQYTKDGNGVELATPIDNAVYKNAGAYVATAALPADADKNILDNYGINAETSRNEFAITKASLAVTWSGHLGTFTYDGTDQGVKVKASATLRGDDVTKYSGAEYLIAVFSTSKGEAQFKDAGEYSLVARFADSVSEELNNNYNLTNANLSLTMNKAKITNISFSGSDSWTYSDGKAHYYFVTSDAGKQFEVIIADGAITAPVVKYAFDDKAIEISYSGGDSTLADVSGNNGIKNAGTRTITATVAETANYEGWSGAITVTVQKGTLTNIVMDSYKVPYDGLTHRLYARNADSAVGNGVSSQVKAPDGSTVTITYKIAILEYYNKDFAEALANENDNGAINAGIYAIQATVTCSNYNDLVLPDADGDPVILTIEQVRGDVIWAYKGQSEADFTYNATNQSASVRASILGAGTSGSQNRIELSVDINLLDEINIADALKKQFVVAGKYSMSASFSAANDNEYQKLNNNYKLSGQTVDVTMKKYVVQINWYVSPDFHNEQEKIPYNPESPCVYSAEYHGVYAEGIGIGGVVMEINTAGTFSAIDAASYNARVSSIKDGVDKVEVDEQTYELSYNLNYTLDNTALTWKIAPRPITITVADGNFLSKIYDGSAVFSFNANGYLKSFVVDAQNEKVVNVEVTYKTLRSAYADSHFTYFINNVVAVDKDKVFLPISSITANAVNVRATFATVVFDTLQMERNSQGEYNYTITSASDGIIQTNDDVITPCDVEMRMQDLSHVYNGETYSHEFTYAEGINSGLKFNEVYGYNLFLFYNVNKQRMQLVNGNHVVGSVNIGGNVNAGEYGYVVNIKVVDAESDGAENYNVTITNLDTAKYTVEQRKIGVTYSDLLQSLQSAFKDVTAELAIENSDFTDIQDADALTALIQKDGLQITLSNAWTSATYNAYTLVKGAVAYADETPTEPLTVIVNNRNYTVDAPILQITYLQIKNAQKFEFYINNLADLMHLDADNYGLNEMRGEFDPAPTYTQTADIDGLVGGSYTVMPAIRNFRGYYLGDGHSIRNITISQISDSDSEDSAYAGFFARITEGGVEKLTFEGISVYASSGVGYIGGFAGLIDGATIKEIDFNGTIYAYVDYVLGGSMNEVLVGGFVGGVWNAKVSKVNVAVKLNVNNVSSDRLCIGGFAGLIEGGDYQDVSVFADVSTIYKSAPKSAYFGGIAGYVHGDELVIANYRYLSSSVYVYDGASANLYGNAFGNDVTFETAAGTLYDSFIAVNDGLTALINDNMIRDYLLPVGANGTAANPVEITNFRQISLILAYPYMNFKVTRLVRTPLYIPTYHRGFYGAIIYEGEGSKLRSDHSDSTSDTPLTDAAIAQSGQNVTIRKKEEN
ncbi:MAG: InlB B-repeat-containing protein [Firmicutes bacterium]|nr:InlB B-repeat-containing protein [Bacillota bacterium]